MPHLIDLVQVDPRVNIWAPCTSHSKTTESIGRRLSDLYHKSLHRFSPSIQNSAGHADVGNFCTIWSQLFSRSAKRHASLPSGRGSHAIPSSNQYYPQAACQTGSRQRLIYLQPPQP